METSVRRRQCSYGIELGEITDWMWQQFGTTRGNFLSQQKPASGTYRPVIGDFDGDGRDDLFWYAPGSGADVVWWGRSTAAGFGTVDTPKTVNGTYTARR